MIKKLLSLYICLAISILTFAQNWEGGLYAGLSTYQGDLVVRSFDYKEIHAAYGGFLRYNFMEYVTLKLGISGGTISGDDANATRDIWRLERNLSFRSSILEFGANAEINLFGFDPYNLKKVFSPYFFGGIAVTYFNPKTLYQGEYVALQPLGTEGQGISGYESPYNLTTISFPVGFGLKYAINDLWNIGIEAGVRYTRTDYLDDVSTVYVPRSILLTEKDELTANLANRTGEFLNTDPVSVPEGTQRGNSENNDTYWIVGVTISYNFIDNGLVNSRNR